MPWKFTAVSSDPQDPKVEATFKKKPTDIQIQTVYAYIDYQCAQQLIDTGSAAYQFQCDTAVGIPKTVITFSLTEIE